MNEHLSAIKHMGVDQLEVWKINNRDTKNAVLDRRTQVLRPQRLAGTPIGKMCMRLLTAHGAKLDDINLRVDDARSVDATLTHSAIRH